MVARAGPINQNQLDVLRWVGSGCLDGLMTGNTYKLTAKVLEWRGLLTVSRKRGVWRAEITEAGRHYLEHGDYPDGHWTRKPARQRTDRSAVRRTRSNPTIAPKTSVAESPSPHDSGSDTARRSPPETTARISAERRSAARALIDKLVENEQLVVHRPDDSAIAEWRKVIDFAKRHSMIPDGYRVEKQRTGGGDLRIMLLKGPHANTKLSPDSANAVTVPDSIEKWHPLLAGLDDPGAVFDVSASLVPRVLRFLHVLLTECAAHGCALRWSADKKDGIRIEVEGLQYRLTIAEEVEKRELLPTPEELAGRKTYAWQRVQAETRMVPNGRLVVSLHGATRWDRRNWADRKRWTIEDKISAILEEIDKRVFAERERQAAAEREEQQRQRDWEAAMESARAQFQEDRRIAALDALLVG
ncbi:hypothetical protein APR11_004787 [Nocardia amikacinitolerans]|uniref:hypothetical protein n=1 Tax=Nocardia amikacinitolerans TaxID=756689 RepID=UPI0020A302E1|nr:hypothetical protein [Nocardia amikacinitolerans]MCP2298342.1 hypothetical protein [Nocardia amikacinitolerans]